MERLAVYYEKNIILLRTSEKPLPTPAMMILMLIIILFVPLYQGYAGIFRRLRAAWNIHSSCRAAAIRLGAY